MHKFLCIEIHKFHKFLSSLYRICVHILKFLLSLYRICTPEFVYLYTQEFDSLHVAGLKWTNQFVTEVDKSVRIQIQGGKVS